MERGQLAADFFLIAHDEFSGKLKISRDLLGCGLVAAQFGALIIAGRLGMSDGRVIVRNERGSGQDEIGAFVVKSVQSQHTRHTVRTWTRNLADVLYELVGRRLVDSGLVRREPVRSVLRRRPDRFPAVDLLRAARPRLRLEHMLRNPKDLDLHGAFLAALIWAIGVENVLDPGLDRAAAREVVRGITDHLPPELYELLTGAQSAAAAVSLTVRR